MKIYKFKDNVDGNYAFILAKNLAEAEEMLALLTSVPFNSVGNKYPEDLSRPIVLLNNILPF